MSWSKPCEKWQQTGQKDEAEEDEGREEEKKGSFPLQLSSCLGNNESPPSLLSVTPDSSPESSLTKEGAEELLQTVLVGEKKDIKTQSRDHYLQRRRLSSCPNLFEPNSEFWSQVKKNV